MGEGLGVGEEGGGIRITNWQLQNSHRDVKYGTGDTVDNVVITTYGVRWVQIGGSLCKLYKHLTDIIFVSCCTPETDMILNVNCNGKKINLKNATWKTNRTFLTDESTSQQQD